jgi:hypothetical protein
MCPGNEHREEGMSSPSHVTVDGQSTSLSWYGAPSGAHDQGVSNARRTLL